MLPLAKNNLYRTFDRWSRTWRCWTTAWPCGGRWWRHPTTSGATRGSVNISTSSHFQRYECTVPANELENKWRIRQIFLWKIRGIKIQKISESTLVDPQWVFFFWGGGNDEVVLVNRLNIKCFLCYENSEILSSVFYPSLHMFDVMCFL